MTDEQKNATGDDGIDEITAAVTQLHSALKESKRAGLSKETALSMTEDIYAAIERVAVTSSNIEEIGYDLHTRTLEVQFRGGRVYRYGGVSKEKHVALMRADSVGKYFAAHVKKAHPFERVDGGE